MRIIKFIFKSVILLLVIGGIGFLLAREILLFMGVGKMKSSLSSLRSMAVQRTYFAKCKEKGSTFSLGDDLAVLQLRFISSNEYVTEILCSQFSIDPIIISQEKLPQFVGKKPGESGIIWGNNRSGVTLEIFGRSTSILVEDRLIDTNSSEEDLGIGPRTSCSGYGYFCCQMESEKGDGQQLSGSLDCPKSCFSQCLSRPVVLAFNTEPALDLQKRVVFINSGEDITFSFVIDAGSSEQTNVRLDYGDGTSDMFYADKQIASHSYRCLEERCQYNATLVVENEQGITAADLPIMRLSVVVKGK